MKLPEFLEKQLLDFVGTYKKYYEKTFSISIFLTIVFFSVAVLLLKASKFNNDIIMRPEIIWQFFFRRYSSGGNYCLADLAKIVFIFFVSFFAIPFYRFKSVGVAGAFSFRQLLENLHWGDFFGLLAVLLTCGVADYFFVQLNGLFFNGTEHPPSAWVINDYLFHLRIYIPLISFAVICGWRLGVLKGLNTRKLLYLYVSVWLFNEFSYETMLWIRAHIFSVLLMVFYKNDFYHVLENVCCIPFTAFYFLGYASAMVNALAIMSVDDEATHENQVGLDEGFAENMS